MYFLKSYLFGSFGLSTKEPIQSCFVRHCQGWCQCGHQCHLCTVLLATWSDKETSYVHMSPVYAHQIFSDSDLFSNGSHFGTFYLICSPAYIDSHRNFIIGMNMYMCTHYMLITFLVILICSFQIAAILVLFFDLLCCPYK